MNDGIYNGYVKIRDSDLDIVRCGPGTLIHPDGLWRIEGYWLNNDTIKGEGVKEFNDGRVYVGKIFKGKFHGKVSSLFL